MAGNYVANKLGSGVTGHISGVHRERFCDRGARGRCIDLAAPRDRAGTCRNSDMASLQAQAALTD
jgi:hypothetical protein